MGEANSCMSEQEDVLKVQKKKWLFNDTLFTSLNMKSIFSP